MSAAWQQIPLGDLSTLMTNGFVGTSTTHYVEDGIPYLMANNVRANWLDPSKVVFVSDDFHSKNKKSILREGDILTVQTGFIGVSCLVSRRFSGANAHALIITRLDPRKADSRYVCQYINSEQGMKEIARIQTAGGRPHLNTGDLALFPVPLPPLQQQRGIADVLQTWDEADEGIRTIVAAKVRLKWALMQELLTGERRFSEFRGTHWRIVPIGEVLQEINRYVNWDDEAQYNLLSVRRRSGGFFFRESLTGKQILTKVMKTTQEGDFTIARMQAVHGAFSMTPARFDGYNVSDSYSTFVVHPNADLYMPFFDHLSHLPDFYKLVLRSAYGVSIEKMTFNVPWFLKETVFIPSTVEEQRKIAEVLDTADTEIAALQFQLEKLKAQKRGLMQRLLSGEISVNSA